MRKKERFREMSYEGEGGCFGVWERVLGRVLGMFLGYVGVMTPLYVVRYRY